MSLDLRTLLGPVSLDEFFARYWESRPLVLTLGRASLLGSLLEVGDVEFLTASLSSLDAKWIRLVNNRPSGPMREFQRSGQGLSMERILEAYREGTTVVLNELQQRWAPIRDLAQCLWRDFTDGADLPLRAVGVNAYLSPPNAEGLAAHSDSHCVFILQLSGRKTWTLHAAREEQITLDAGDLIYIPHGLVHKAHTADSHSLHLAVGVYPYTWGDILADAVRVIPECRRSLPRGILGNAELSPETQAAFAAMVKAVLDRTDASTALGRTRAEVEQLRERSRHRGFERCHGEQRFHRLLAS